MSYDTATAPAGAAAGHPVGGGIAFLALMIVCACIAAPVVIRARRRLRRRYQETAVAGTRFQTNGHNRTPAAIQQADRGFDLEAFLRQAEMTFWLVQRACEGGQIQRCRAYLAPGLYQELLSMTQQRADTPARALRAWGKALLLHDQKLGVSTRLANADGHPSGRHGSRPVRENLRLLDVRQVEERQVRGHRPERDTLAVQFHAAFMTRPASDRGGRMRDSVHDFTESWLFSRGAGGRTISPDGYTAAEAAPGGWTVTSFEAFPPRRPSPSYDNSGYLSST